MKNLIVVGIIILLLGMVVPSTGINIEKKSGTMFYDGKTLYVGGDGPGNYTKIQGAINDANDGDTVFVYDDSSPYYENLSINKSIDLIGEENKKPIIDGYRSWIVVNIYADNVTINGFKIQSSERLGIVLHSDYNCISNNVIQNNLKGIFSMGTNYTNISNNIITRNYDGIRLWGSNNDIIGNTISYLKPYGKAIELQKATNNRIMKNVIKYCSIGIFIRRSSHNIISQNVLQNNSLIGIFLQLTSNTIISQNNLINNTINASFIRSLWLEFWMKIEGIRDNESAYKVFKIIAKNSWNKNYWGKPQASPYLIYGLRYFQKVIQYYDYLESPIFNWINFDWHPAQKPYDI